MDDSSQVMSLCVPAHTAGRARLSVWQHARPVLVYDPTFPSPMPPRSNPVFAGFTGRPAVIWLGALTLGVVVGGTLAFTNPQAYSATGLLLGLGADEARAQDELSIILSDEAMRGVVDRVGVSRVAPECMSEGLRAIPCAARVVSAQMQARVVGDPNGIESGALLRLTATHKDPAIAVAMLDAAVAIDRKIWNAAHLTGRVDALDPQLTAAQSALDETSAAIARIRAEGRVTNIAQDLAQASAETTAITQQDSALRLRQVAAVAELTAAKNALRATPETVLDSREVSSGDPGQDSRALLLQLKLQRAHLSALYAPGYPGLAELDHKIEAVETAMKIQAKSPTSVTRDVRNPILAVLAARMATLDAESAGIGQQRQELQRQLSGATTRETKLRTAETLLSALQLRQSVQEAAVRQLTLNVANLRAQDLLFSDHLAQRRLLQRPEAVVLPWTGWPAAALIGAATGLIAGAALSLLAWRRRAYRGVVQASRGVLERLEPLWVAPAPLETPQIMAVPLPPTFGTPAKSMVVQPGVASTSLSLANALENAAAMRMFALRRDRDIRSLGFDGQAVGRQGTTGG